MDTPPPSMEQPARAQHFNGASRTAQVSFPGSCSFLRALHLQIGAGDPPSCCQGPEWPGTSPGSLKQQHVPGELPGGAHSVPAAQLPGLLEGTAIRSLCSLPEPTPSSGASSRWWPGQALAVHLPAQAHLATPSLLLPRCIPPPAPDPPGLLALPPPPPPPPRQGLVPPVGAWQLPRLPPGSWQRRCCQRHASPHCGWMWHSAFSPASGGRLRAGGERPTDRPRSP